MSVSVKQMKVVLEGLENSSSVHNNFYQKTTTLWEDDLETLKEILRDLILHGEYEFNEYGLS